MSACRMHMCRRSKGGNGRRDPALVVGFPKSTKKSGHSKSPNTQPHMYFRVKCKEFGKAIPVLSCPVQPCREPHDDARTRIEDPPAQPSPASFYTSHPKIHSGKRTTRSPQSGKRPIRVRRADQRLILLAREREIKNGMLSKAPPTLVQQPNTRRKL